jgi:membrane protease YdiL (CAAX protease family)
MQNRIAFKMSDRWLHRWGILLLLILGCGIVVSAFATLTAGLIWSNESMSTSVAQLRWIQAFSSIGMFMLPALIFSYLMTGNWFSFNYLNEKAGTRRIITVTWLACAILPIIGSVTALNQMIPLPNGLYEAFPNLFQWFQATEKQANEMIALIMREKNVVSLLLNLLILGVLPGICEELLFRGTLFPLLSKSIKNRHIVIWVVAIIFSAIHLQFSGFIPRLLLGAYLGYLLVWSGSLWLPILAHALHNSLSVLLQYFSDTNHVDIENIDFSAHLMQLLPLMVIFIGISGYGMFLLYRGRKVS